jgi:hypothetical protein
LAQNRAHRSRKGEGVIVPSQKRDMISSAKPSFRGLNAALRKASS